MQLAFEYLEIPSYELSKELFLIAYNDIIKALSSTYTFALITSRPLIIIISLVSRYVFAAFKVIAQCTMSHLIVGLKEAYQQFIFASKWFIEYQKSLPPTAVYLEIAAIGFLIGAYALRRYIRKKKYVERVQTYCKRKKDKVLMKRQQKISVLIFFHSQFISGTIHVKYESRGNMSNTKRLVC